MNIYILLSELLLNKDKHHITEASSHLVNIPITANKPKTDGCGLTKRLEFFSYQYLGKVVIKGRWFVIGIVSH
jgi:hypothetical protein